MSDMGEIYRDMRAAAKEAKRNRLSEAKAIFIDPKTDQIRPGWTKHTEYHWSTAVQGSRFDYWPSGGRWRWNGRSYRGNPKSAADFVSKRSA